MKRTIKLLFVLLFLAACKPGIPTDIIQPDDMALVLNDIHIVDGYITSVLPDSSKIIAASLYKGIYNKFGVDSAKFYKSMDYYYKNPKVMDEIYKKVNATLLKKKLQLVRTDSLANVKIQAKARLKAKTDSTKAADSLKKVLVKKKADSVLKVKSRKKLDSIKKSKLKMKVKATRTKRTVVAAKPIKI